MYQKKTYENYSTKLNSSVQFNSLQLEAEPPSYQLQIAYIPHDKRIEPDKLCKLIHYQSKLTIPGQFTYEEAVEILKTSSYWDWELDRDRIPRCADSLRSLLEEIGDRYGLGGEADA